MALIDYKKISVYQEKKKETVFCIKLIIIKTKKLQHINNRKHI